MRKLVVKDRFMEGVRAGVGAAQQLLDRLEVGVVLRLEGDMVLEATREDEAMMVRWVRGRLGGSDRVSKMQWTVVSRLRRRGARCSPRMGRTV